MRVYLMRMVECGIPRRTAIKVYRDFKARDKLPALKNYIERVEALYNG